MPGRKIPRPRCKYSFVVQRQRDPRRSWVTLSVLPIIESCIPLCSLWTYMHYLCRLWWIKLYEEEGGITYDYSRRAFFDGLRETRRGEPLVQRQLDIALSAMYISVLTALSVLNVPVYVCVDIFVALCIDNITPTISVCFDISVPCTCLYQHHSLHCTCLYWHQHIDNSFDVSTFPTRLSILTYWDTI